MVWFMDSFCLVPFISIIIAIIFLIISAIDITMNKGMEVVQLHLPQWHPMALHHFLVSFFISRGYFSYSYGNRIYSSRGNRWLMGVRTFDIILTSVDQGTDLTGYFYLQSLWPVRRIKLSRYGYYAILPRRQGWRLKNELFYYLGVKNDS
jgi:hypothetical protein